MPDFDALLAELLEEPEEILGVLNDVVNHGRLQADDLSSDALQILAGYDLVAFLITRAPRRPMRTWVYPTPLALKVFGTLEREAERILNEEKQRPRARVTKKRKGKGNAGVSR